MKLVLTNKVDGLELIVDSDKIVLLEASKDADGVGSHIVFGADLGRMVKESPASIAAAIGVVAVMPAPAGASLMSVAKK